VRTCPAENCGAPDLSFKHTMMISSIQENGKIDVVLFDFGGVIAEEGWQEGLS